MQNCVFRSEINLGGVDVISQNHVTTKMALSSLLRSCASYVDEKYLVSPDFRSR